MPTITVSAELEVAQGPQPKVTVFVNGVRTAAVGPFHDWRTAERVALELNDDLARVIAATVRNWLESASERMKK